MTLVNFKLLLNILVFVACVMTHSKLQDKGRGQNSWQEARQERGTSRPVPQCSRLAVARFTGDSALACSRP